MLGNTPHFTDFKKATKKLDAALLYKKTEMTRDASIKRFEICFDLAWKAIKTFCRENGVECYSPRDCFKSGFQMELINNDKKWLKMIEDRNLTAHLYSEPTADTVYSRLPEYLILFKALSDRLNRSR